MFAALPSDVPCNSNELDVDIEEFAALANPSKTVQQMPAAMYRIKESVLQPSIGTFSLTAFVSECREIQTWALEGEESCAYKRQHVLRCQEQRQTSG